MHLSVLVRSDALRDANPGLYARLSKQVRCVCVCVCVCLFVCFRVLLLLAQGRRQESEQFGDQILRDIHRTFPEHVFFKDGGGVRRSILSLWSLWSSLWLSLIDEWNLSHCAARSTRALPHSQRTLRV